MHLQFVGSGDAFGSGGRFNTCFHVVGEETNFLIDCGASSLIAMNRFGIDRNASFMALGEINPNDNAMPTMPKASAIRARLSRVTAPVTIATAANAIDVTPGNSAVVPPNHRALHRS